ncbi:MAG: hypothetical protein P8188_17485 [Gemmatimonadota bacterium]
MPDFLARLGPTLLTLAPSFIVGFLLGLLARRALRTTLLLTGGVILIAFLANLRGLDFGAREIWARNASSWAGENIEGAQRSLAATLPSATAAGVGAWLGFGRKGRRLRKQQQ